MSCALFLSRTATSPGELGDERGIHGGKPTATFAGRTGFAPGLLGFRPCPLERFAI